MPGRVGSATSGRGTVEGSAATCVATREFEAAQGAVGETGTVRGMTEGAREGSSALGGISGGTGAMSK
jgi:hypothetical protein